jgi:hypothetical protein
VALGTAPQRLLTLFENNWQASRTGRGDIPDIIKHNTGTDDPDINTGVLAVRDREQVFVDKGKHDLLHCYIPEANPPQVQDRGYAEEKRIESVQVDIEIATRPDPDDSSKRLSVDRMMGDRDKIDDTGSAPEGGLVGEVKYILETKRRGLDEWDVVSVDLINWFIGNSNANVSYAVEFEEIARNTVQ